MAFGDMPNDIPMLRWAGLGVAMGNAHPEAVEAADEVTAPNTDDGLGPRAGTLVDVTRQSTRVSSDRWA